MLIRMIGENPDMRDFIKSLLSKRYMSWGLSADLAEQIIDALIRYKDDPETAVRQVYTIIDFDADKKWQRAYRKYKEDTKYSGTYSHIRSCVEDVPDGGVIADIGCGDMALSREIAKNKPKITVIGTDIFPQQQPELSNVRYVHQTEPLHIPDIKDGSVDVVVMNAMLHHVPDRDVATLLDEIRRILKPGGRLVLIEDTLSVDKDLLAEDMLMDREMTRKFADLVSKHGTDFAKGFLAFNDWYANHLVHRWYRMPVPYSLHTMEEWEVIMKKSGYMTSRMQYYGFPEKSFHKPSIGVIVFTRAFSGPGSFIGDISDPVPTAIPHPEPLNIQLRAIAEDFAPAA